MIEVTYRAPVLDALFGEKCKRTSFTAEGNAFESMEAMITSNEVQLEQEEKPYVAAHRRGAPEQSPVAAEWMPRGEHVRSILYERWLLYRGEFRVDTVKLTG